MKRCYIVLMILSLCVGLLSCGKQTGQQVADESVLSDNPSPTFATDTFLTDTGQTGGDDGTDVLLESTQGQEQTGMPTPTLIPTSTSVPTLTEIPSCTPSPEPTPIPPTPTLPPLDITLVDDKLPWDDQALPETDHVYVVRFIPTERDDLLVAYTACVDVKWDINDFYDDKKRPKILYTWWLRDDAFCFVSSRGGCPVGYNGTAPDYIAQDLSRWEDVEPGMYNISHDLFRWIIKWYEPIWWCGVKDGEIVYVRQHIEG